ncbi:fungal-specific transcription factor domain-containing protein [Aspergillus pseudocaelatus]|uniref:Fungal-specific transcription factor domain-containing protein n=1 Tax=Aspergillus pseudocaelatus TaxID=1825620 RepID=A0ABQ6WSF3_9EURO|nr:fungal-specific transcription factor domain-containing protein [Aspergillus pseudocaelatus]
MQAVNDAPTIHPPRKRRRIEKACDRCRRLKIKCDGQTPCKHCATYERACTYDVPNRRPKALARYTQDLEDRLQTVERLLKATYSGLDLVDPRLEPALGSSGNVQGTDSGITSDRNPPVGECEVPISQLLESASPPARKMEQKATSNPTIPLPRKEVTYNLLTHALQDACVLHRFVDEPLFYLGVDYIYETPAKRLIQDHSNKLALFYAALALGNLFVNGTKHNMSQSTADTTDGSFYFDWAVKFLNFDECQDLVSLQAVCFLVIYLQSSGQLEQCYSYVGVALRSAVALGLHRRRNTVVNPVEREIGKRVFWVVWRMDIYSSSMLGIPPMLSTDLIDQSLPEPIDVPYSHGYIASCASVDSKLLLAGANAHIELTLIMPKVTRLIKAFKRRMPSRTIDLQGLIDHSDMVELEQQLRTWFQNLPSQLLPGGETTLQVERIRQLLRIAYAYVQMVLYEPLVRCMPKQAESFVDPQILDYVMKYASVMRNIVSTGVSIHKAHAVNYSSRSTMISTTYSAILSLIVFILNIPAPSGTKAMIFKEALEGREILEELSSRNKLADRYVQKLNIILERFQGLPRPLPGSPFESTVPSIDTETGVLHRPPLSVTGEGNEEPLPSQLIVNASALQSDFLPVHCNLVFGVPPYHAPDAYVFDNVSATAPTLRPGSLNAGHQTSALGMPDNTHIKPLDYNLIGGQDTESRSQVVENSTTLGLSQVFTSDAVFADYSTLAPSISYQELGLSRPMSFDGQQPVAPELMPSMAGLPPDMTCMKSLFESAEPAVEQLWGGNCGPWID